MRPLRCSPRRAARWAVTLGLFGLVGCTSKECSNFPTAAQDEAQRAALLAVAAPAALPAKGDILLIGGGYSSEANVGRTSVASEFYSVAQDRFVNTGTLVTSRVGMAPFAVASGAYAGQVLVAGGASGKATANASNDLTYAGGIVATIEAYNPKTGNFARLGLQLDEGRTFYGMGVLKDGTVLISGGLDYDRLPLDTALLFDPVTRQFTTLYMNWQRVMHSSTLLPDGTELLVGGVQDGDGDTSGDAEIYDPRLHSFTRAKGQMPSGVTLAGQTATVIAGCKCAADGKVLLAGGFNGAFGFGSAVESSANTMLLYDPKTQTFSAAIGQMTDPRFGHTATLLPGGKVLLAGGVEGQAAVGPTKNFGIFGFYLDSAEIFDAATGKTSCIGGTVVQDKLKRCKSVMVAARALHAAALLPSGKVLLAGGVGDSTETANRANPLTSAEFYNPSTGKFAAGPALNAPHVGAGVVTAP